MGAVRQIPADPDIFSVEVGGRRQALSDTPWTLWHPAA